jgi:S-adenosylmethionine hydrolase
VEVGKPLLYLNSLDSVSLAINQQNFAKTYGIGSGPDWSVQLRR